MTQPESLGACAEALLGHADYARWSCRQTYGYAPSAAAHAGLRSTGGKHGKIDCIVWLSEWREGPGVKEAEEAPNVALFRSMPQLLRRAGGMALARGHARGGEDGDRGNVGRNCCSRPAALIRAAGGRDADRARGEAGAGVVRRAGGRRAPDAQTAEEAVAGGRGARAAGGAEGRRPRPAAQDRGRRDPPEPAHCR